MGQAKNVKGCRRMSCQIKDSIVSCYGEVPNFRQVTKGENKSRKLAEKRKSRQLTST